jgi:hypothetical protein
MDERFFGYKKGKPIPDWDIRHRLPVEAPVGPACKDSATIFEINSTYMEISDQPYMRRHWHALAVLGLASGSLMFFIFFIRILFDISKPIPAALVPAILIAAFFIIAFGIAAIKLGRDEFFSLKRRPIRLNRQTKKLYAIRRRKFFKKPGEGDEMWEIPWNQGAIFCIHRDLRFREDPYHIWHYSIDNNGNVVRAFALGRLWTGKENIKGLLAQWNYWSSYMNHGPIDLPPPPLYFKEKEDLRESFLFCLYDFGFQASFLFRCIVLPYALLLTAVRVLALLTCREPVWPDWVERDCQVDADDPYAQPRDGTPVGWAETAIARDNGTYPFDPQKQMPNWHGEPDPVKNALLWLSDNPPSFKHEATAA